MTDIITNQAKGAHAHYARLGLANDAFIAVPILAAGVESDAVLRDYDTLAQLLAGASDEAVGYGRKTLTGVSVVVDDATDRVTVDCDDIEWAAPSGAGTAKLIICVDLDTTSGTDADLIPLYALDFVSAPGGGLVKYQVASSGLASSS